MLEAYAQVLLSNAAVATALGVVAYAITRLARRPALSHALWAIVLLKLVTPPFWHVPIAVGRVALEAPATAAEPAPVDAPRNDVPVMIAAGAQVVSPEAAVQPAMESVTLSEPFTIPPAPAAVENAAGYEGSAVPDASPATPVAEAIRADALSRTWHRLRDRWSVAGLIGGISVAGSLLCFAIILLRLIRFRRALRLARPAPPELIERLQNIAQRMGVAAPRVQAVRGAISPMVFALFGRPQLLVPIDLWLALDPLQQSAMLAHELAHLKRGDHRLRWLELIVTALYWWHPLVWLARRELHEAEEFCCDAWVAWLLPGSQHRYAAALLDAVDFAAGLPLPRRSSLKPSVTSPISAVPVWASGLNDFARLKRRLLMIKTSRTPRQMSWIGTSCVFAVAACVLPLAPLWGQETPAVQADPAATPTPAAVPLPPSQPPVPVGPLAAPAPVQPQRATQPPVAQEQAASADQLKLARDQVEKLQSELGAAMLRLKELEDKTGRLSTSPARAMGGTRSVITFGRGGSIGGTSRTVSGSPSLVGPTTGLPLGVSPDKTYRVVDADGRLSVYTMDGKLISVSAPGVVPMRKTGNTVAPADPLNAGAAASSTDEMAKHLDRVDHQVSTLLQEVQQLRNEIKARSGATPPEPAIPAPSLR